MASVSLRAALSVIGLSALCGTALGVTVPPEADVLNRTHVRFQWDPIPGSYQYELQIVEDDGSPMPFQGADPVFSGVSATPLPRRVVTSGLAWGGDYAWRVRGITDGSPTAWSGVRRFEVAELPADLPLPTVTGPEGGGHIEPGVTLFNVRSGSGIFAGGYGLAVDQEGNIVWLHFRDGGLNDLRLLPNGNLLYDTGNPIAGGGIAEIASIDGEVVWQSPEGGVHHEASPMPNGNIMALVNDTLVTEGEGGEELIWQGNRLVEWDYETKEIVWEWSEFENYSLLDFDEFEGPAGDWTHSNSVFYNPDDNSVYLSARNLSRVTRIDYDTGEIVYNMGFDMPSGETDFGDNLFSYQHAPELQPNGNMVLYDNGNRRDHEEVIPPNGTSKAIELAFTYDEFGIPVDAEIVWEWTCPTYNQALGDADRLPNGNTLVTCGVEGVVYEVSPAGEVQWSIGYPDIAFPGLLMYRAERVPSLYVPIPTTLPGDLNDNCIVGSGDLNLVLANFGCTGGGCEGDANGDGSVDSVDLNLVLGAFGSICGG